MVRPGSPEVPPSVFYRSGRGKPANFRRSMRESPRFQAPCRLFCPLMPVSVGFLSRIVAWTGKFQTEDGSLCRRLYPAFDGHRRKRLPHEFLLLVSSRSGICFVRMLIKEPDVPRVLLNQVRGNRLAHFDPQAIKVGDIGINPVSDLGPRFGNASVTRHETVERPPHRLRQGRARRACDVQEHLRGCDRAWLADDCM